MEWGALGGGNSENPSEIHTQLKPHDISVVHNIRFVYPIMLKCCIEHPVSLSCSVQNSKMIGQLKKYGPTRFCDSSTTYGTYWQGDRARSHVHILGRSYASEFRELIRTICVIYSAPSKYFAERYWWCNRIITESNVSWWIILSDIIMRPFVMIPIMMLMGRLFFTNNGHSLLITTKPFSHTHYC